VCPLSGCSVRVNYDLPKPQPLLLIQGGSLDGRGFYFPEDADGVITIATGQTVLLACPGNTNNFSNTNIGIRTAFATCVSGTTFSFNLFPYDFSNFCRIYPFHTARYSDNSCNNDTNRHIEIGVEVESLFYKLMDVCFDDVLYTTLYVKATIVSGIAGFQREPKKQDFIPVKFFPGMSVETLYDRNRQRETISGLLGSTQLDDKYYLNRGHLAARADFVYGSQHRATFHYVNIAPQWQSFNGGNWEKLKSSVRDYVNKTKLDHEVYTGTYGVATLPNVNGVETELYLYVDVNNNKAIPVPKLFWKAVYDPKSQAGVVVVGINNPFVTNLQEEYLICEDVCSKISWLQWDQKTSRKDTYTVVK
jgi:DNA/RNA endonuclease G (NUC1)